MVGHGPPYVRHVRFPWMVWVWLVCVGGLWMGCGVGDDSEPPEDRPPIVWVTFEGLRADAVGALGGEPELTPHLDRLASEADWVGRGVAASSWTVPAAASISTGLPPWKHQALYFEWADLPGETRTLAEALEDLGYETAAYTTGHWISARFQFHQGFDVFEPLRRGGRAQARLRGLRGDPSMVWVHFKDPSPPWTRRDWVLAREAAGFLPRRLDRSVLERYLDPELPLPPHLERVVHGLYRQNVAWADERLGRLLKALRASGHYDRTLVLVTGTHGQALGEEGQVGDGTDLSRRVLEVPLVVKLPADTELHLQPDPKQRVATSRIFATLVEAAGGEVPPGVAPSLFHRSDEPILSELYLAGERNLFSLLDGDLQLLWATRFAPPEPDYFRARRQLLDDPSQPALGEPPEVLMDRLEQAFLSTRPLTGRSFAGEPGSPHGPPELKLVRWGPDGTETVDDPSTRRALAERLRERWGAFLAEEHPPRVQARRWPSHRVRAGGS